MKSRPLKGVKFLEKFKTGVLLIENWSLWNGNFEIGNSPSKSLASPDEGKLCDLLSYKDIQIIFTTIRRIFINHYQMIPNSSLELNSIVGIMWSKLIVIDKY